MHGTEATTARLTDTEWNLNAALNRIAHWLPTQGPLKEFIHHNTLHAFQDLPFEEALATAAHLFGARDYLPLSWYQDAYEQGRISPSALRRILRDDGVLEMRLDDAIRELLARRPEPPPPRGIAREGLRSAWREHHGVDLDALVHPTLFRWLASYLDQGVSVWRMPHASDTLWRAVQRLVLGHVLPFPPLGKETLAVLELDSTTAVQRCLERLVGDPALYERYLLEVCLSHPGWSGMVRMLEASPGMVLAKRQSTLQDALALELLLQWGWLDRKLGGDFAPLAQTVRGAVAAVERPADGDELASAKKLWHEAFEWTLYEEVLASLENRHRRPRTQEVPPVQAYFCIDDRECSLRRHLEEIDPRLETLATAGFFGIDFLFQSATSAYPIQHCPVVLTPKHVVREVAESTKPPKPPRLGQLLHLEPSANTLFRGWLLTQTLGIWSCLRLAWNVLRPDSKLLAENNLTEVKTATRLDLLRTSDEKTPEGHYVGYTVQEMADRVFGVFRSTGLLDRFAKLIVFVAHGSASANNPHFAAYDCGACSGRPGSPNARSIAWMANHPEVRAALRAKGLALPDDCVVVGALHNTARDEVRFFDLDRVPESHRAELDTFRKTMEAALERNALERCRRFELAPKNPTPAEAHEHVKNRAASLFEPRPELNHATNALAIVGRRELTRGLFFDRRAFLNSYDPTRDPKGEILTGILNAVIPVCGGINLEYFFSRIDNEVYGAGTKLPHNVVSLIGVANGVEGDLRTGLPWQMVEVHDPVRLLVIVEQTPAVALEAVTRNPANFEWVRGGWVRYAAVSPEDGRTYYFDGKTMAPSRVASVTIRNAPSSLDAVRGQTENVPVHRVGKE